MKAKVRLHMDHPDAYRVRVPLAYAAITFLADEGFSTAEIAKMLGWPREKVSAFRDVDGIDICVMPGRRALEAERRGVI